MSPRSLFENRPPPRGRSERVPARREEELRIPLSNTSEGLTGELSVPPDACGLVLFPHGSGSSRRSARNRSVAAALQAAGIATLQFGLLTDDEEQVDARTGSLRFDIEVLSARLHSATDRVLRRTELAGLPIGYCGASTGAAAALVAAAERRETVQAVVGRGGRPDLARGALGRVKAPTLLIVGSLDQNVLAMNRVAMSELRCQKELAIVRGATHLFEEPGALEEVARLASSWFARFLGRKRAVEATA